MIIAVVGKGGVGKTTVAALILRRLIEARQTPVLAIDADPSSCLGAALGIAVPATLADQRERLRAGEHRSSGFSSGEYLALAAEDALVESQGFDLMTMGRPEGKGCYCFVNNLIRDYLDRLGRAYRHVLVDCEAGLEHFSRRTAGRPDRLICVTNRSRMAAEAIRRSFVLYKEIHDEPPRAADLVLNGLASDDDRIEDVFARVSANGARFEHVLHVPEDPQVIACDEEGRSLLTLTSESAAVTALSLWEPKP